MSDLELFHNGQFNKISDNNVRNEISFSLKFIKFIASVLCVCTVIIICYYDIYQTTQIKQYVYDNAAHINATCGEKSVIDYRVIVNTFVVKSIFDLLFCLFVVVNIVVTFVIITKCNDVDFPHTCWFFVSLVYMLYNILSFPIVKDAKECDFINAYQKYALYTNWYVVSFVLSCIYGVLLFLIIAVLACKSSGIPYVHIERK